MPQRRNSHSRDSYNKHQSRYTPPMPIYVRDAPKYYVKTKPGVLITRFLIIFIICVFMITGGGIRQNYDFVLADVYPESRFIPDLVEEEEAADTWTKNLIPPVDGYIYLAWDYDPLTIESIPAGVNVLVPTWFYLEEDETTGKPVVKNLLQLGKTKWNPQEYVEICHANGVSVWGCFVCLGQPDLAKAIVTDMDAQQDVIDQLVEWTIDYNLDGISLDFEKMYAEYNDEFVQMAKNIKDALPSNQNIVSAAVTVKLLGDTSNNLWQSYDRGGLAEVIDYIAVMTYEGGDNELVPRASIEWVEKHVQRLLEEMPSNKLILGIPFYGVDYIGKVINSDSFNVDPLWQSDDSYIKNFYASYISSALANGYYERSGTVTYVEYWMDKGSWNDEYGITQYIFVDTEGYIHTVYVDDESSLYQKSDLIERYGLAGAGIWRKGFGSDEMWAALADGLTE